MNARDSMDRNDGDRVMCGDAAYAAVSLLLEERKCAAASARRADGGERSGRSARTRAGLALVVLGTWIGGRSTERQEQDTLPSPALPRPARAGRAG